MTFDFHLTKPSTPRLKNAHPGGMRIEKPKAKAAVIPPKTGSESGFIGKISIDRLRAGRA